MVNESKASGTFPHGSLTSPNIHVSSAAGLFPVFRYHGGTLDGDKAIHWARLVTQLLNHANVRNCQASPKQVAGDKAGLAEGQILGYTLRHQPSPLAPYLQRYRHPRLSITHTPPPLTIPQSFPFCP